MTLWSIRFPMRTHISKIASIPLLKISLRTFALPLYFWFVIMSPHLWLHPQQRTWRGRFGSCSFRRWLITFLILQWWDIQVLVVQLPMKLQLGLTLEPDLSWVSSLLVELVKVWQGFDTSIRQVRFSFSGRFNLHASCGCGPLVLVGEYVDDF